MPDKTFHYVASYMLKGYAMETNGIAKKYRASSYNSLKQKISSLSDILDNAYGKSYCQISNPTLVNNEVNLGITNANKEKSRDITHSFGIKLRALMLGRPKKKWTLWKQRKQRQMLRPLKKRRRPKQRLC